MRISVIVCVVALVCGTSLGLRATVVESLSGPYNFPRYDQCDPRWGNDKMGINGPGERNTICNEGCAMTSTTMALAGLGVTINGAPINPGTFNTWLENNGGYLCMDGDCNNLNLTAPERLSTRMSLIGEDPKPDFLEIAASIKYGRIVNVAHVRNRTHFVLLVDSLRTSKSFLVHDPAFNQTIYTWDSIADIIRFKVNVYPRYDQCNSSWGSNVMGKNGETICAVGCLMSSISSAMAGTGITVDGQFATPASVNTFLQTHDGFVGNSSALSESVIATINPERIQWPADGMHTSNDIPFQKIKEMIDGAVPRIVIANVMHGQHFVLIVGYRDDNDTLIVNDSGFNRNSYSYSNDVVGWRIFDMR